MTLLIGGPPYVFINRSLTNVYSFQSFGIVSLPVSCRGLNLSFELFSNHVFIFSPVFNILLTASNDHIILSHSFCVCMCAYASENKAFSLMDVLGETEIYVFVQSIYFTKHVLLLLFLLRLIFLKILLAGNTFKWYRIEKSQIRKCLIFTPELAIGFHFPGVPLVFSFLYNLST